MKSESHCIATPPRHPSFHDYHESVAGQRFSFIENLAIAVVLLIVIVVLAMIFLYKPF